METPMTDSRTAVSRTVNESIRARSALHRRAGSTLGCVCECASESCLEMVDLTVSEYEAVRSHPSRFVVAPSIEHVDGGVERVVERCPGFWVVEKLGGVQARSSDRVARQQPSAG
jgi:hypothetical protein